MKHRLSAIISVTALLSGAIPAVAQIVPDAVPDVPVLSTAQPRGTISILGTTTGPAAAGWTGRGTGIAGTSVLSAGEHIYSDFVLDAWGADDGDDVQRLALLDPLRAAEPRLERIDPLQQAAGDQFDAPAPVGVPDHYGNDDLNTVADLVEARWEVRGDDLALRVRLNQLDPSQTPAVQVTLDGGTPITLTEGFVTQPLDHTLEAVLSGAAIGRETMTVSVVAGVIRDGVFVPGNAAYRDAEPVTIYNDRAQALALAAGDVHSFTATLDLDAMRAGTTQDWQMKAGYHERVFRSGDAISSDTAAEQGAWQPYGLYVPTAAVGATTPTPTTFWLHYRGGKTHSGAAWSPRLFTQLGEEMDTIVVSPRARGTSTWYVTEAHQDFFEVFADVHILGDSGAMAPVDPQRRYVSGYSMGGYGTWLLTTLYPDLFAAGFTQSGAMTQGLWTGLGPDDGSCAEPQLCYPESANGGNADAQLTYRALDNLRYVPIAIHHGTDDELVPITGIQRMAARMLELGYRHEFMMFDGYEHFTQAITDEWHAGAAWMNRFTAPYAPDTVAYRVVPQLVDAINTVTADGVTYDFRPDGAYWVDDIVVTDADVADGGIVTVTSGALDTIGTTPVPKVVPFDPRGHTAGFQTTGLDWQRAAVLGNSVGFAETTEVEPRNTLTVDATNVTSFTVDGDRAGLDPTRAILILTRGGSDVDVDVTFANASPVAVLYLRTP